MRRREPLVECVVCGAAATWRCARRGVLPFGVRRVWLCRRCFFAFGCDTRPIADRAGDEDAAAG
jgi:hypothetical protein